MYSDWMYTINKLTDEQAGKLTKHLLAYVNDKNPELNDILLEIAFEPIKQQLKRDLKHWDNIRQKRVEYGRKGGLAKAKQNLATLSNTKQPLAKLAVSVNDNVNVNVNVNDTVNDISIPIGIEEKSPDELETKKETFGREDINTLLADFERIMGFKSASNKDRIFATHILKNYTHPQIKAMLEYCSQDAYAPRIGSLEKMWFKRGDIVAGIKGKINKNNLTIAE